MPYIPFEDIEIEEQVKLLHKALTQLKSRFEDHEHNARGEVRIGTCTDSVDIDGVFE